MHPANLIIIPALSGLYIVTVDCDQPISVNASDLRIADRCITINRENRKFGRAKNLRARFRSYQKTFHPHQVNFKVVALLEAINAAETACARRLSTWRVRGRTGRPNEWLAGISVEQVEALVLETLIAQGFSFTTLTASVSKEQIRSAPRKTR